MNLSGSKSRLVGITKELALQWGETKNYWNDAKSREFEQRFLDELFSGVNQAVSNIESLERILTKIRTDCE